MSDRTWFPNGVSSASEIALTADIIGSIKTLLEDKGFLESAVEAFLAELDNAQETYFSAQILQERSKPGAVRNNLQNVLAACTELSDQLHDLDQNSISLIIEARGSNLDHFRKQVLEFSNAIRQARSYAQSYPKSGRLDAYPLHLMALRVRYGIEKHLGVKATATKPSRDGALFDEILSKMVFAIRRIENKLLGKPFNEDWIPDVHKLTLRAVNGIIWESGDIPPRFIVHRDDNR